MHIYYLRNKVLIFFFIPIFHCRKEKLPLYFTFFSYVLVMSTLCWKMEKLFKCMSDYCSVKRSYIWPWVVARENPVGETLLQQNFCIHSVFIVVLFIVTFSCMYTCISLLLLFCLDVNKINTCSVFIKLDYQFITKDITQEQSNGRESWDKLCRKGYRASVLSRGIPLLKPLSHLHVFTNWKLFQCYFWNCLSPTFLSEA